MCDYTFKIIIVGNSNAGKTSIIRKFVDYQFDVSEKSTIGVDFKTKEITVNDKKAKIKIWDTAGQERYRAIINSYYRGTKGIMICFDLTNRQSYENVEDWYIDIQKFVPIDETAIILVGNKLDLDWMRKVSYHEANQYACERNMKYIEISARENQNILPAFEMLVKSMIEKINDDMCQMTDINIGSNKNNGRRCCFW